MEKRFGWEKNKMLLEAMLCKRPQPETKLWLEDMDAAALLQAMEEGRITAEELTEHCLRQMRRLDGRINAMISIAPDARELARGCDQKRSAGEKGALLGLPFVIKDNIHAAGFPTTMGALALQDVPPAGDSRVVERLRKAGAVILGKASLSEYASTGMTNNSLIGQTRNPYDLTRTPGGSSGGSGAAVALGYAAAALGTDGVNSVRSPASANGLVGLRPTKGLVSGEGIAPSSQTQDMPGILTRSARDAALILNVLAEPERKNGDYFGELPAHKLAGRKIALLVNNCGCDREVLRVVEETVKRLQEAKATVIRLDDPVFSAERMLRENNVMRFEQGANINRWLSEPKNMYPVKSLAEYLETGLVCKEAEQVLQTTLELERTADKAEYEKRKERIAQDKNYILSLMQKEQIDAFCYPTQKIPVVKIGNAGGQAGRNGILASCLGLPAVSFPAGFTAAAASCPAGVSVGMEFLGAPDSETLLLGMVHDFESRYSLRRRPPDAVCPPAVCARKNKG